MAIADASGFPVAAHIESASPHEVKLVDKTIDNRFLDKTPDILVSDKAYDSDPLDQRLKDQRGIELIAPCKQNRKKSKTQDIQTATLNKKSQTTFKRPLGFMIKTIHISPTFPKIGSTES